MQQGTTAQAGATSVIPFSHNFCNGATTLKQLKFICGQYVNAIIVVDSNNNIYTYGTASSSAIVVDTTNYRINEISFRSGLIVDRVSFYFTSITSGIVSSLNQCGQSSGGTALTPETTYEVCGVYGSTKSTPCWDNVNLCSLGFFYRKP